MLIVEGISYNTQWTREMHAAALEVWPACRKSFKLPEDKEPGPWDYRQAFPTPMRMTLEEAAALQDIGVKLEIAGVDGTQLTKMTDAPRKWQYGDQPTARDLIEGHAVQITIADMAILLIDTVCWLDDACTEEVQMKLDEGWRILAVCPPNAQRRPSYIFGKRS